MTKAILRGLTARPLRTALTTFAILLGVALVSAAFTLTDTMRSASTALSASAYDGTDAVVTARTAFKGDAWTVQRASIDASIVDDVKAVPGVTAVAGDITDEAKIIGSDGKQLGDGPYFGIGLDSEARGVEQLTPFKLKSGRWATAPDEVVLDAASAKDQDWSVGQTVRISTRGEAREFELVGVATFGAVEKLGTATAAIFDVDAAQTLFAKQGSYDSVLVAGGDGVRQALADALPRTAQVETAREHDRYDLAGLDMFIGIIRIVLLVFGGIAVLVGSFTIFNTLSITVAQRTKELGVLRMVGASRGQVLRAVLLEALALGVLASALGVAAGVGLAKGLDGFFDSMGMALPDAGTVFEARTAIVAVLVGVVATVLAGLIPAWRATRVAPVVALRSAIGGDEKVGRMGRMSAAVVGLLGRPAQAVGGTAGKLARRNAMRHPGRTVATAMALVIGVALITLVTIVATGLKDTATASIDERVQAGHVVVGSDGWSPVDPKIERDLADAPGVSAVSSIRQDGAQAFGDVEFINAIDPETAPAVLDFQWKQGSKDTIANLGRDGAIVDAGWATEHHIAVGDRFEITAQSGEKIALVAKGIEDSPVLDVLGLGPITISAQAFDPVFAEERYRLTLVDGGDPGALQQALAPYPDAMVQSTGDYADEQAASIDPLLAIFGAMLALCVIVSLFGIVNALVLATFERTRELGTLRSLGMSRRQVRRMVRHESVITALLGAAGGITLGLGLAYGVTSAFEEEGLQFVVPVGALIGFTVVAVVAGVLAAVLPARRAARIDVLSALAYE